MSNTLTNLIPTIYEGLDVVSRELSGLCKAVSLFPSASRVAKDQVITYPVVPAYSAADIVPAATGPAPADSTIGNGSLTIDKVRGVTFHWSGEEQLSLKEGYNPILRDQIAQNLRTLVGEMETDIATLYSRASRAAGVAGTVPFASSLSEAADVRQLLADNGAPLEQLQLIVNTAAGTKLRSLAQLTDSNRAGGG